MTNKPIDLNIVLSVSINILILLILLTMGIPLAVGQVQPEQMTNSMAIELVQAKISPDLIILAISQSEPHFQLDNASKEQMLHIGVSDDIISAMALTQAGQQLPDDAKLSSGAVAPQVAPQLISRGILTSPINAASPQLRLLSPLLATVYVNTNNGFDILLQAALHAHSAPITLVPSPEQADYVLDSAIFHTSAFVPTADVAFKLTNNAGYIMWTYIATHKEVKGGSRSIAEDCAKRLNDDLFWIYRRNGG